MECLESCYNLWNHFRIFGVLSESMKSQFLEFLESYWNLWNIIRNSWISSKSLKYVESLESCMDSWLNLPEIQTSLETSVKKSSSLSLAPAVRGHRRMGSFGWDTEKYPIYSEIWHDFLSSHTAECIGLVCRRAEIIRTAVNSFLQKAVVHIHIHQSNMLWFT